MEPHDGPPVQRDAVVSAPAAPVVATPKVIDITVPKGWQLRVTLSGNSADVTGFEVTNAG